MSEETTNEVRPRRAWIRPEVITDYVRRLTARGDADAVRPCSCSHPWGLHCVDRPHACLISRCKCNRFSGAVTVAALDAEHH